MYKGGPQPTGEQMKTFILGVEGNVGGLVFGQVNYTFLLQEGDRYWNSTLGWEVAKSAGREARESVDRYVEKGVVSLFEAPWELPFDEWRGIASCFVPESSAHCLPEDAPRFSSHGFAHALFPSSEEAEKVSRGLNPDYWAWVDDPDRRYDSMLLAEALKVQYLPAERAAALVDLVRKAQCLGLSQDHAVEIVSEAAMIYGVN